MAHLIPGWSLSDDAARLLPALSRTTTESAGAGAAYAVWLRRGASISPLAGGPLLTSFGGSTPTRWCRTSSGDVALAGGAFQNVTFTSLFLASRTILPACSTGGIRSFRTSRSQWHAPAAGTTTVLTTPHAADQAWDAAHRPLVRTCAAVPLPTPRRSAGATTARRRGRRPRPPPAESRVPLGLLGPSLERDCTASCAARRRGSPSRAACRGRAPCSRRVCAAVQRWWWRPAGTPCRGDRPGPPKARLRRCRP
jgi:hypothetical protein